jgi:RNA polymerase sigma-70 factor, ECF subfamily
VAVKGLLVQRLIRAVVNQKGTSLRQYMEPAGGRSDEDLLRAVADDDRGTLRELYDRHAPWLLLRLRHRGADAELAEEVVQDTFLGGWRKPLAYSATGAVPAWIWAIGISRLIDRLRQRHDQQPLPQEPRTSATARDGIPGPLRALPR